jgi:hypothetical protein
MKDLHLTLPEFGFIVATRAALGAGVAFLISRKLNDDQRRAVGLTLFAIGVVTTIPAAMAVLRGHNASAIRRAMSE